MGNGTSENDDNNNGDARQRNDINGKNQEGNKSKIETQLEIVCIILAEKTENRI